MKYSVIVPIYNEEKLLKDNLNKIYSYFLNKKINFELILANDGSTDKSIIIMKDFLNFHDNIIILNHKKNRGKGFILKNAIKYSRGEFIFFTDADLPIGLNYINLFETYLDKGYDFVIASKFNQGQFIHQNFLRKKLSYIYSLIVRLIFKVKLYDLQCGFKLFKKNSINKVLYSVHNKGWFWDTELLIKSLWNDLKIKEISVKINKYNSRKSNVSLFHCFFNVVFGILKLKINENKYKDSMHIKYNEIKDIKR